MRYLFVIFFTLFWAGTAFAGMVSVSVYSSSLRSHPSATASYALLKAPRYYPLTVMKEKNGFLQVMDFLGRSGWISRNEVEETRCVVVKNGTVNIRKGPGTDNPVLFMAHQGVTFKVLDKQDNWLKVIHESGKKGWVYKNIVWGF